MADNLLCWKCGADISHLPFPLGRMSKCEKCKTDLHVCYACKFYDKSRANQCQEPVADAVVDKRRANFCGYFEVKANAFQSQDSSSANASQQELAALFGEPVELDNTSNPDKAKSELEKLFGIVESEKKDSENSDPEK